MLKKVFSTIIILMLLLPNVSAEVAYPELVPNGGFESVVDGNLTDGWSGTEMNWGATASVSVTSEKKHSGSNAVKFINDGKKSPALINGITNLTAGVVYEVSYWLYAELKTAPEIPVGITLEFYQKNITDEKRIDSKHLSYSGSTNARWTFVSKLFVLPANATAIKISCILNAEGYAYFDDISLKRSDKDVFGFWTSHIFHYTDDVSGQAKVTMPDSYTGKTPETKIYAKLSVFDGEAKVHEITGVPFLGGEAHFSYSVQEILKKKGHAYKMRMEVTDSNGAVLDTYEQNLYIYKRPEYLDENGIYYDENKNEIMPIIAYHLDVEDYEKAAEGGFTMAQVDYGCAPVERKAHREAVLDAADENGLKAVFCLYYDMKNAAHPDIIGNTKKLVAQYKDDPRIFGWLVQDEPLGAGITEEAKALLELSYKTIRDIDPNHPVVLADYNINVFKESVKYCDIFIPNSYGIAPDAVRAEVAEAVKYATGRPVYPNVGAYSRTGYEAGLPSGDRMQHCVYQGFVAGAKGVSVYSFSDAVYKPSFMPLYNTPLWEAFCKVFLEELPAFYDLFVHTKEFEKTETETYFMYKWTKLDGDYYVISTRSYSSVTINLPIGTEKSVVPLISEINQMFSIREGTLSVTVPGGDAISFKVFSAEDSIQILKNGIPAQKLETGRYTVKAPSDTKRLYACFYEVADGKEQLKRVVPGNENTLSVAVFDTDKGCALKVYAWDASMAPTAKPQTIS